MEIQNAVVLVTGSNRGIGYSIARAFVENGAAKVYAGARNPALITDPDLIPLQLDITDSAEVSAAAKLAADTTILVNNAGIFYPTHPLTGSLADAKKEMEVNYLGTWAMAQAFAPVLARNGGGAMVNMLSVASWRASTKMTGYASSKSAEWSLTNALRMALRSQGTLVTGVHCGFVDTESTKGIESVKVSLEKVTQELIKGILENSDEVLVDETARKVKASLHDDQRLLYAPGN
ncbi:SDR family oxidoreductase [Sporolactobacillus pectinivorans]|uniref:SDR family oxidoreductase n=1 Tax=Sporolactobacillus pectinivorans TaxID=1591408 RepID=UPI000C263B27|nr:SDR family oxidoreductase [Sporolactobacillus pectinivorans]